MVNIFRKKRPLLPVYAIFPLLAIVIVNFIVYFGTDLIAGSWKHYDLTLPIDKAIPVIPGFVIVYLGCYVFWIVNYVMILRLGKEHCFRFATADIMSRLVCAVFFLALPTANIRPVLSGGGICTALLGWVYGIDAPTRLFPSIHCLVSWFCFIGIRGQRSIPRAYRIFSCLFALLVCASTQFTKQHYIVDAIGGILLAEGAYRLAFHTKLCKYPQKMFDKLYNKCFHRQANPVGKRVECDE